MGDLTYEISLWLKGKNDPSYPCKLASVIRICSHFTHSHLFPLRISLIALSFTHRSETSTPPIGFTGSFFFVGWVVEIDFLHL
ncbi:hypothetical protein L2E82_12870 [Cichorium intybus]|uniref:Uncharacterized protein n=1 Tax=Cichorium intybus TaxID=13427 RepID=A0ACB9GH31_CICIN|nr:hypothetical protein L2E82_12870 [Cichorium intybus]